MPALTLLLLQSQAEIQRAQALMPAVFAGILLIGIVVMVLIVIPFWFICKKAGFSPWLSLLNVIPVGNLVLLYVLAFAEWKVAPLPQQAWGPTPPYPPPPQPPYPPQR